jgi:hypothetical protein
MRILARFDGAQNWSDRGERYHERASFGLPPQQVYSS